MKRFARVHRLVAFVLSSALLAACGGGGGGGGGYTPPQPTATPCPSGYTGTAPNCTPLSTNSGTFSVSASAPSTVIIPSAGGYNGTIVLPAGSVATTGTIATSVSTQNGHILQGVLKRSPQAAKNLVMPAAQTNTAMLYFSMMTVADVEFSSIPSFSFTLPAASSGPFYLAVYTGDDGWQTLEQGTVSGSIVTFPAIANEVAQFDSDPTFFALYTGGVLPTPSPTPAATSSPGYTEANFICPSSDTPSASTGGSSRSAQHIAPLRSGNRPEYSSSLLAVKYSTAYASANAAAIASRDGALGVRSIRELRFDRLGTTTRIVAVNADDVQTAVTQLRSQAGVESVSRVGMRYATAVSAPYLTNDPYFAGFSTTVPTSSGATPPPPTYHVPPYYESASVPGQWDMHAIGLEHAFAYSQSGNGSGITNANALGSSSVKVAIVDTGEDTTHPELAGKVTRQRCYITDPSNKQSTSDFTTDPQGHGTDVSGIAVADINNGLGFVGAGGNASLMAYRVFPSPDTTCDNEGPNGDDSCGASTADIASAINDAVANGANVISMSIGGGGCNSGGVDTDPTENAAVQNAIAHNVIVVAASGNGNPGTSGSVDAPGCGNGVIAVGATALDDGQPNGRGSAVGTAANPIEYVASYSQFGTPASSFGSSSAWGIVAPGGDPVASGNDADDLHWIENIWTSTPADKSFSQTGAIPQVCNGDYPNDTGTLDCRIDIAGTSMATPHVAGAVALILSVNSSYQSPSAMKTLLCSTADDLNKTTNNGGEGCGRLDVYRAMAKALGDSNLP